MLVIGKGPGPKNVLAENENGERVVFTYRNWKKVRKEMADEVIYGSSAGFVQFPVEERELDAGQTVRDVTIRSLATGELLRITLWPDFEDTEVSEGDFVAVDGKVTFRTVGDTTYTNMSARKVAVVPAAEPKEREVVKKSKRKSF